MTDDIISKDFELRQKWVGELSLLKQKAFSDLVSSIDKIIQTLGIIAGFGFTAIGATENIMMFLSGEALLFSSIFYGIYKVHLIHEKENAWIDQMVGKIDKAGEKLKDKSISPEEKHNNFREAILENEKSEPIVSPLPFLMFAGIVGAVFLLLSFISVCYF